MSVTVPPLRTQSMPEAMVSGAAHGFEHEIDALGGGELVNAVEEFIAGEAAGFACTQFGSEL